MAQKWRFLQVTMLKLRAEVIVEEEKRHPVRKTAPFAPFYAKKRSFCQDRLGTDIGKALKRSAAFSYRSGGQTQTMSRAS
eukprot:COSAG06_NODE_43072_length_375_cov_1.126812_1_plen_80_part_00